MPWRAISPTTVDSLPFTVRAIPRSLGATAVAAYNSSMNAAHQLLPNFASTGAALMERLTLFVNHVLASEPVAVERLRTHAGRTVQVELRDWPRLLPALPDAAFRISPAGLLEWCGADAAAEAPALSIIIDASNPALLLAHSLIGEQPKVDVLGDAALAADVNWLADNLRWDARDDLARIVGPVHAERIGRIGAWVGGGLRQALRLVSARAGRRPG